MRRGRIRTGKSAGYNNDELMADFDVEGGKDKESELAENTNGSLFYQTNGRVEALHPNQQLRR